MENKKKEILYVAVVRELKKNNQMRKFENRGMSRKGKRQ